MHAEPPEPTPEERRRRAILEHLQLLNPELRTLTPTTCLRCGGTVGAGACQFHPDAKAFAFGTGRFDFNFENWWDTPHDRWFCCMAGAASAPGCCTLDEHTTSPDWWLAFVHLAPPLEAEDEDSDDGEDDEDSDSAAQMEVT